MNSIEDKDMIKVALLPGERIIYKTKCVPFSFMIFIPSHIAIATNKRFMIIGGFIRKQNLSISYDGIAAVRSNNRLLWSDFILHLHGHDEKSNRKNRLSFMNKSASLALFSIVSNQVAYSKGEPPLSSYNPMQYTYKLPLVNGPSLTKFIRKERAFSMADMIKEKVSHRHARRDTEKKDTKDTKDTARFSVPIFGSAPLDVSHKVNIPTYTVSELVHTMTERVRPSRASEQHKQEGHKKIRLNPDRDMQIFRIRNIRNASLPPIGTTSLEQQSH